MSRHFLELADAATLETEHYLLAQRAVIDAVDRRAMAVIHGSAGLGKTYTVDELVDELPLRVLWTSFPSRPAPRAVAADLYEQLSGRRTRLDRFTVIARLVEHLADGPQAVVVDESQLLTGDCIELLRYLHDHRATRFALVLVGGNGTWAVLSREPMLASRVYRRVRFQPLTRTDVLGAIPVYHPIYADVESELIGLVDDHFEHGNMRNWAAFTSSALSLIEQTGRDRLDERIARNVFALHGGGTDAEPPLTVIVDPDDDLGCLEELRRLHARPHGQILCEPDPTATSADLARYLLEALGKQGASLTRRQLWALVDCHLRAERVRELVVARAHTLTFPALRDLANHAHDATAGGADRR